MLRGWVFLSDVCRGRDNNLNLIRMVAATAVLVSHAWPLALGKGTVQPLQLLIGYNLGTLALFVFFCVSGFLVSRSFERQATPRHWLAARFLRLFPGLAVVLVLTVLVLGPLVTTRPVASYAADPGTYSYVFRNLGLAFRQSWLPGVFEELPTAGDVNGPLWTLYHEVLCYGGVLIMGLLGAFRAWTALVAVAAVYAAVSVAVYLAPEAVPLPWPLPALALPFAIGVGFYVVRRRLPLSPLILAGLVLAAVLLRDNGLYRPLMVLTLCYGVFVLAYLPGGFVRRYNRLGDYSYGIYIYAWPVQQTMVHAFGPMGPLTNVALALPVALLLAVLSWRFVEKPALALVPHSDPVRGAATPAAAAGAARGDPDPAAADRAAPRPVTPA